MSKISLETLLTPKSIAVVGASPKAGTVGNEAFQIFKRWLQVIFFVNLGMMSFLKMYVSTIFLTAEKARACYFCS